MAFSPAPPHPCPPAPTPDETMETLLDALREALRLLGGFDPALREVVGMTLRVTGGALLLAGANVTVFDNSPAQLRQDLSLIHI